MVNEEDEHPAGVDAVGISSNRTTSTTGNHPRGVEAGGVWGTFIYREPSTCTIIAKFICCHVHPKLSRLFCGPLLHRDGYEVHGKVRQDVTMIFIGICKRAGLVDQVYPCNSRAH